MLFEFLIPKRPVSLQTRNRKNLQAWKQFVEAHARKNWTNLPVTNNLQLTLVYLCDNDPVDVDNIIKPIQDSLVGLIYDDDLLITDVESHRRPLNDIFDMTNMKKYPTLLVEGILLGKECVYVRISHAKLLEDYL